MMRPTAQQLLHDPLSLGPTWTFDWSTISDQQRAELIRSLPPRSFRTSGSSGQPVSWSRSGEQLLAEAEITASSVPRGIERVISCVEPSSLYGFAVTVLLAAWLGTPVHYKRWTLKGVAIAAGAHTAVGTIPPTWRSGSIPAVPPGSQVTFLHAGSSLPKAALDRTSTSPAAELRELFGTTETGLVATRQGDHGDSRRPWEAVADVRLFPRGAPGGEGPLEIGSPRIGTCGDGRTMIHTLDDFVVPAGPNSFIFNGRRLRHCCPDGRKVHLDQLDDQLWAALAGHVLDLTCQPVADPVHGEHVELRYVPSAGAREPEIRRRLRLASHLLDVVPRYVVEVGHIARTSLGKPRRLTSPEAA